MNHNQNYNTPYLILLRVESYPRDLWRSMHGNVYTVPFTRIQEPATSPLRAPELEKRSPPRIIRR